MTLLIEVGVVVLAGAVLLRWLRRRSGAATARSVRTPGWVDTPQDADSHRRLLEPRHRDR